MMPLEALAIMEQVSEALVAGKRPTLNECVAIKQALQALETALTPTSGESYDKNKIYEKQQK